MSQAEEVDLLPVPSAEDAPIEDDAERDSTVPAVAYDISSYGADPDVETLVRRLRREEILVPPFQRGYVWRQPEASRFIESLLLGLPVPGVFLAKEQDSNKFLVIDGQQRLKTLQFFYDGVFNPRAGDKRQRVFELVDVQKPFNGKTYDKLDEPDRRRLDNSIIHTTIVKQENPPNDDTSIYHIFERLNSAGRVLAPQEIRVAIYHGSFIDAIRELNAHASWRSIFGPTHARLKDQELVLRFLALLFTGDTYERPMSEFVSKFTAKHKRPTSEFLAEARSAFEPTIDLFWRALGRDAFRPIKALNAAVFDSAMVGLATRLRSGSPISETDVAERYGQLMRDSEYVDATQRSTSDASYVSKRLGLAKAVFAAS